MKLAHALVVGLATVGTSLLVAAPTAAAQPAHETCIVTFQPWDQRQYHAAVQHADGTVQVIFAEQNSTRLPPTDVTIPADAIQVLWATRLDGGHNPANPDDYFPNAGSKLRVGPDCTFIDKYMGSKDKPDSVIIRPGTPATTTTTAAPTTTSTAPSTTLPAPTTTIGEPTPPPSTSTTEQPPTGTTSTVSMPTTTIEVDEPLLPEPTTTAPAPTPEVPAPSTSTTADVELFTATSVESMGEAGNAGPLPHTGWGFASALYLAGGLLAGGLALWPVRRRMQRAEVQG